MRYAGISRASERTVCRFRSKSSSSSQSRLRSISMRHERRAPIGDPRDLIPALARAGFYLHRTEGDHHFLRHMLKSNLILTLPNYVGKALRPETILRLLGEAGLKFDDLRHLF